MLTKERGEYLWQVRTTLLEMASDRGYLTKKEMLTFDQFMAKFSENSTRSDMDVTLTHGSNGGSLLQILFLELEENNKQVPLAIIAGIRKKMKDTAPLVERTIVVSEKKLSSAARDLVAKNTHNCIIEFFLDAELRHNYTHNELVPKHTILTPDQKLELLKKYRCTENQLPKMLSTDPVARYLGAEKGQVMKVGPKPKKKEKLKRKRKNKRQAEDSETRQEQEMETTPGNTEENQLTPEVETPGTYYNYRIVC